MNVNKLTNTEVKYVVSNLFFILSTTSLLAALTSPGAGTDNTMKNRVTLGTLGLLGLLSSCYCIPTATKLWTAPAQSPRTTEDEMFHGLERLVCDAACISVKYMFLPGCETIAIVSARSLLIFIDRMQSLPRLTETNSTILAVVNAVTTATSFISTCYYLYQIAQENKAPEFLEELVSPGELSNVNIETADSKNSTLALIKLRARNDGSSNLKTISGQNDTYSGLNERTPVTTL